VAAAPQDKIPVFVRAGSIIPMGKAMQYTGEKSNDTLTINVYGGANGIFMLYEDEGDNYNYEKGVSSTITFNWNDVSKTLTIENRKGNFPGMLGSRQFNIVMMGEGKGSVENTATSEDKSVTYSGKRTIIKF
jgi:alpha-D-xyloside xylohydrolase